MIPPIAYLLLSVAMGDGIGLPVDEIPAYREALRDRDPGDGVPVPFLELWNGANRYRGQRVAFTGRIARRFRAEPSGDLPARVELWLEQGGNLVCAVVPETPETLQRTGRVTVRGTSLGIIRYAAGDAVRLAPLIVGSRPPEPSDRPPAASGATWDSASWGLAIAAILLVTFVLAIRHARRPPPRRAGTETRVEFLS